MPTYDYRCPKGHEFELVQKMSDEPKAKCPTCGALAERRISGGGGFLFKGEGFYITDYRSEDYKKKASAESGGSDASGEGATGKPPKEKPAKEKSAKEGAAGKGKGSDGGTGGSSA